jgi:hypothetical protein
LDQGLEVHALVELVGFGPWIADPPFGVEILGNLNSSKAFHDQWDTDLHNLVAVDPEVPAAILLQFDGRQRQRSPPARGPRLNLGYFCGFGVDTHFIYDDYRHAIK